ncbi:MAG: CinA family nicotinamide mononucleotide deamidase-related protein [Planctomycetota bacterium]
MVIPQHRGAPAPLDPTAVEVVAVGDELLDGAHPDLNSPWIGARLAEYGRQLRGAQVVGDEEPDVERAVRAAAARAALVFVCGGLGPTLDDVTRHGVALAAGRALYEAPEALANVRDWYTRAGRDMPEVNRRQALMPEGAALVYNRFGTAPGFRCSVGASTVIVLPGPPRELHAVWDDQVHPWLVAHPVVAGGSNVVNAVRRLHFSDIPESQFAQEVGPWMDRAANPLMGCTVKGGVLSVRLVGRAADASGAEALVAERARELLLRFPGRLLAEGPEGRIGFLLGRELLERSLHVTLAESCTGGLIAGELTRVPGISAVFRESFVTYSDAAKHRALGVPEPLLAAHGAVSAPVAEAMASGARRVTGADLALSVTGVAGPDGGTSEKPVGLVWFGLARLGPDGAEVLSSVERRWPPAPRDKVREWATQKGLALLLSAARGEPTA